MRLSERCGRAGVGICMGMGAGGGFRRRGVVKVGTEALMSGKRLFGGERFCCVCVCESGVATP